MEFNEAKTILALKEGSYKAFSELYDLYVDRLYSFVIAKTNDRELAQDIVQETFMKLWDIRETLDCYGNIRALLFTIARHHIVDSFRKQVIEVDFTEYQASYESQTASNQVDEQLNYSDLQNQLDKSKQKLSRRERQIYELSREKNLSVAEIAELLDLSPQTVKNQLTTILKKLRQVKDK